MNLTQAEFKEMVENYPWEKTAFGARATWPARLANATAFILDAGVPMAVVWGPDHRFVYNAQYAEVIQEKHPAALRAKGAEIFSEIWSLVRPLMERARGGEAVVIDDLQLAFKRGGAMKPAYFSFSYNPLRGDHGEPAGVLAVVIETTARVAREEERANIFDTVLSAINDFAYTFDREGRFVYVNKALLDLWGLKLEQAVGKNFFELNYPHDLAERLQRQIEEAFTHKCVISDETRYVSPTGVEGFYEYIFSPVIKPDGSVSLVAGSTRNITNRKKLEVAAVAAAQAKDDFIAALSHELRTPLTPALMTTNALREDPRLPEDVRVLLRGVERNIALEARLIDDLLDLTAITRGKISLQLQPCDVHSLLRFSIDVVRQEAETKHLVITRSFQAVRSGLTADAARIQQVMWNLLRNAAKFSVDGGTISLRTEDVQIDGQDWLRVVVTDNGVGIDPDDLERIFDQFDQGRISASHRFGGLGLGLSIARALVHLHRGNISAHSAGVGRGATFIVELPEAQLPPVGIEAGNTSGGDEPAKASKPLRLLLVDDHESTLLALSAMLRREGHSVVAKSNVAEALQAAAAGAFDFVISDLGLPDGTGNELMAKLNSAYGLRGIALSGYGMEEDVVRSQNAGFAIHLTKPVPISHLRKALASLQGMS